MCSYRICILGSNFYPVLGAYSSSDSTVIEQHMQYCLMAGIGKILQLCLVTWIVFVFICVYTS